MENLSYPCEIGSDADIETCYEEGYMIVSAPCEYRPDVIARYFIPMPGGQDGDLFGTRKTGRELWERKRNWLNDDTAFDIPCDWYEALALAQELDQIGILD